MAMCTLLTFMLRVALSISLLDEKIHFSHYYWQNGTNALISLTNIISNNCSYFYDFYYSHFMVMMYHPFESSTNYTIATASNMSCQETSEPMNHAIQLDSCQIYDCAVQHFIYLINNHTQYQQHNELVLYNHYNNYSQNIIHFTLVYNMSLFGNDSIIQSNIISNYKEFLTLYDENTFNTILKNKSTHLRLLSNQMTFYGDIIRKTLYQVSTECDILLNLDSNPSVVESYLNGLLVSQDDSEIYLYFEQNMNGYLCLDDVSTSDDDEFLLKVYNTNNGTNNDNNNSISFDIEYRYEYSPYDAVAFYFCSVESISNLMSQTYKTVTLTLMSQSEYTAMNNNLYDINFINVSDGQTLLCVVISTILFSLVIIKALKNMANETSITNDRNIFNICVNWLIFLDYFCISAYVLYIYKIYTGTQEGCVNYTYFPYGDITGEILDSNYYLLTAFQLVLFNQLFDLRIILFKQDMHDCQIKFENNCKKSCFKICNHCRKSNINIDNDVDIKTISCNCTCVEKCCVKYNLFSRWHDKYNCDIRLENGLACILFAYLGKELVEIIDRYNDCISDYNVFSAVCNGSAGEMIATLFMICLSLVVFVWIDWQNFKLRRGHVSVNTNNDHIYRYCNCGFFGVLLLFIVCLLIGGGLYYWLNVLSNDSTVYDTIYYVLVGIQIILLLIFLIKPLFLMIGCIPQSTYFLLAWFVAISNWYLNYSLSNAYNASYAPFIIVLTPMAMITLVYSVSKYFTQFKKISMILSIFLQLLDYTTTSNLVFVWYFDGSYVWATVQLIILIASQIYTCQKMCNVDNIQNDTWYSNMTVQSITNFDRFMTLIGFGRVWMGCKSIYQYDTFSHEYFNLKLYQMGLESLPSLCLQLYIGLVSDMSSLTLFASILISFVSLSFSIFRIFHKVAVKHLFDKKITIQININDENIPADADNENNGQKTNVKVIDAMKTLTVKYSRTSYVVMYMLLLSDLYTRTFPFVFVLFLIRKILSNFGIDLLINIKKAVVSLIVLIALILIFVLMIVFTGVYEYITTNWMIMKQQVQQQFVELKSPIEIIEDNHIHGSVNNENDSKNNVHKVTKMQYIVSYFSCLFHLIFVLPLQRFDQKYTFQRCVTYF